MYIVLNKLSEYICAFAYQKTLLHMFVCLLLNSSVALTMCIILLMLFNTPYEQHDD